MCVDVYMYVWLPLASTLSKLPTWNKRAFALSAVVCGLQLYSGFKLIYCLPIKDPHQYDECMLTHDVRTYANTHTRTVATITNELFSEHYIGVVHVRTRTHVRMSTTGTYTRTHTEHSCMRLCVYCGYICVCLSVCACLCVLCVCICVCFCVRLSFLCVTVSCMCVHVYVGVSVCAVCMYMYVCVLYVSISMCVDGWAYIYVCMCVHTQSSI